MARRLLNFCLAWTLLPACWGGVLASVCPHLGCGEAASAPEPAATHGAHSSASAGEPAAREGHCARAQSSEGHAAESPRVGRTRREPEASKVVVSAPHDASCSHCLDRPQAPTPAKPGWQTNPAGKVEKAPAPQFARRLPAYVRAFVREVTPAQHDPPGRTGRHLLLSVFLI